MWLCVPLVAVTCSGLTPLALWNGSSILSHTRWAGLLEVGGVCGVWCVVRGSERE